MSACTVLPGSVTANPRDFVVTQAEPFRHLLLEGRVGEARHSAIGVVDNDELKRRGAGSRQVVSENAEDSKISQHCGGDPAAGVADNDCVAELEPEEMCRVDAGVDAGQDDRRHAGSNVELSTLELLSKASVAIQ